jgi:DMSO/TMAO reductase YedYZ molybdopterin-dependent catalytic subunit
MKKTLAISALLLILALTTLAVTENAAATTTGDLVITDRAGQQTTITNDQIIALPSTTEEALLSCYGSLVASGEWTGVKISDLLDYVHADTASGSIDFTAQDGYKISIPMDTALQPNVILAYEFQSEPLQETYRLVVPEANGNVWIALVVSMTVNDAGAPTVIGRNVNVYDATKDFTQNIPQQTPAPTPASTVKPITPTPEPSVPASITPTTAPTNATDTSTNISAVQSGFSLDPVYGAVASVIVVLIVVSLLAVRQKRVKAKV